MSVSVAVVTRAGFPGPSRRIVVEPIEAPVEPVRVPPPAPSREPAARPDEPVPAR